MGKRRTPKTEQIDREQAVLELRRSGETWTNIAQRLGYANASGPQKAFWRILKRVQQEPVEDILLAELDTLDRIKKAYWKPAIVDRDYRAAQIVLNTMDRKAKFLGLDAPTKIRAEVVTYDGGDYADVERILNELEILELQVEPSREVVLEEGAGEEGTATT
jgi:hypothetical protein